jgi:hypothetical protein
MDREHLPDQRNRRSGRALSGLGRSYPKSAEFAPPPTIRKSREIAASIAGR